MNAKDYSGAIVAYNTALNTENASARPVILYNLACSYSRLRNAAQAGEYLRSAVFRGYSNIEHIDRDPDLDYLRAHPDWAATRRLIEHLIRKTIPEDVLNRTWRALGTGNFEDHDLVFCHDGRYLEIREDRATCCKARKTGKWKFRDNRIYIQIDKECDCALPHSPELEREAYCADIHPARDDQCRETYHTMEKEIFQPIIGASFASDDPLWHIIRGFRPGTDSSDINFYVEQCK